MKHVVAVFALLALAGGLVFADIKYLYPEAQTVKGSQGFFYAGEVAPGQSFELKASRDPGFARVDAYDKFQLSGLPGNWEYSVSEDEEPLTARITIPSGDSFRTVQFQVTAVDKDYQVIQSASTVSVTVTSTTTRASLKNSYAPTTQGSKAKFEVLVSNDSIAPERVTITSSLPRTWFAPVTLEIPPRSSRTVELNVNVPVSGEHKAAFNVKSDFSSLAIARFDSKILAATTLKGSLNGAFQGPPIFPGVLAPFYYAAALLSGAFN